MNYSLSEQSGVGTATKRYKEPPSEAVSVEELSRAVGQHALLQAEIDQKIASHIVEMREQLRATKDEVRLLRAQVDQLMQGLAQAIASPSSHPAVSDSIAARTFGASQADSAETRANCARSQ